MVVILLKGDGKEISRCPCLQTYMITRGHTAYRHLKRLQGNITDKFIRYELIYVHLKEEIQTLNNGDIICLNFELTHRDRTVFELCRKLKTVEERTSVDNYV